MPSSFNFISTTFFFTTNIVVFFVLDRCFNFLKLTYALVDTNLIIHLLSDLQGQLFLSDALIIIIFSLFFNYYLFIIINNYNYLLNSSFYLYFSALSIIYIFVGVYEEFISITNIYANFNYYIYSDNSLSFVCNNNILLLKLFLLILLIVFLLISYISDKRYDNSYLLKNSGLLLTIIWILLLSFFFILISNNLLNVVLLLELQTFSGLILYFLLSDKKYNINEALKLEASIKYFLMGALGSSFIFLALSLIYFTLGTFDILLINQLLLYPFYDEFFYYFIFFSIILFIIGIFIKLGVAPFHQWTLDIVLGLPYSILYYFFTFPKIILFIILFKVYNIYLVYFSFFNLESLICGIIILNILISSINGLFDSRLKRILIFSNMSSTATVLLVYLTFNSAFFDTVLIYIVASVTIYAATIFLFNILTKKQNKTNLKALTQFTKFELNTIDEFSNVYFIYPYLGLFLITFLFSITGLPPFVGFFIKFFIIFNFSYLTNNIIFLIVFFSLTLYISFYYLAFIRSVFPVKEQYYFDLYLDISRVAVYILVFFFILNIYISLLLINLVAYIML